MKQLWAYVSSAVKRGDCIDFISLQLWNLVWASVFKKKEKEMIKFVLALIYLCKVIIKHTWLAKVTLWEKYAIKHFVMCCAGSMFSGSHLSLIGMLLITVPLNGLGIVFCNYCYFLFISNSTNPFTCKWSLHIV